MIFIVACLPRAAIAGPFDAWAAMVVAGDWHAHSGDPSEVFDNARRDIAKDLQQMGFAADHIQQYSARPERDPETKPFKSELATIAANFKRLSQQAAAGCFVYITSHGAPLAIMLGDGAAPIRAIGDLIDEACPARPTIVIVSASNPKLFVVLIDTRADWRGLTKIERCAFYRTQFSGGYQTGIDRCEAIRIQLDLVDGAVETIGLRSTRVRNLDGHLITVPNKTMGNATITNVTRRPNIKTVMNIGITYDTPAEKVKRALQILREVYKEHPKTFDCLIGFNKFADSALNIQVVHWWNSTDNKEYLAGLQEMNLAVKERFDKEGINFAFPSQTVYLKQDSDWRVDGTREGIQT